MYPEYIGEDQTNYVYRTLDFWTSGFFPGSLYLLFERRVRYPKYFCIGRGSEDPALPHYMQLRHLCHWWSVNLHQNAARSGTHDLGFMIAPWAIKAWELEGDHRAYNSLVIAAQSLVNRFDSRVQSLRSWDVCATKRYAFNDPSKDFLVIIDNMLNLNLLFWVAQKTGDRLMYDIAVAHARTTQRHHIRTDHSTFHVVNYDMHTGLPKSKFTHQGYADNSCWARGQAWGILGFMETFEWTGDWSFLSTARDLADYFVAHLPEDGVPCWDFDAPAEPECPRDTSAGMVAGCGMLLIYKALKDVDKDAAAFYLKSTMRIVSGTLSKFLTPPVHFTLTPSNTPLPCNLEESSNQVINQPASLAVTGADEVPEAILHGATINNHEFAMRRWADHGLVYADYYFMLLGNMLLEMGLIDVTPHAAH